MKGPEMRRSLTPPPQNSRDVYITCITNTRPATFAKLAAAEDDVVDAADQFEAAAQKQALHTLGHLNEQPANKADRERLAKVYEGRLVDTRGPGRTTYDAIKARSAFCPLCTIGTVSTIDHHLPKMKYPLLAVVPVNLVPACGDCNKKKGEHAPATEEEQTLHPYYPVQTLFEHPWLVARILPPTATRGIVAAFSVSPHPEWPPVLAARLNSHLRVLELDTRFTYAVVSELSAVSNLVATWTARGLPRHGISRILADHAAARGAGESLNTPMAALYRALAEDDSYINGGWRSPIEHVPSEA
ncbi:HNH endonuclease signature motif containing protein [Streptomyces sp. NBC_01298]|uniref:HNH endonuclease signature motif containing protein n=1 Tax=Streptomyces sp. NBC_01298 TaxID=2903817 RepID=UPI002E11AE3F|nr:HNH endonuclease signature motif containing protein [Streptomyces sp. NBC_01298]